MDISKLKNMLNELAAISKCYELATKLSGENFNIFNILGMTTDEVKTHSAFLAELLDPNGSHEQGSVFLELFVKQLNIIFPEPDKAEVKKEKFTGYISENGEEGGFIDVLISNGANAIIIENKIYAGDQENQLKRYYNYGKEYFKKAYLLYLTLDGHDADEISIAGLKEEEYKKISYSEDILPWLIKCREKAATHPILRETITQYINLIKQLTGQTMEEQEINEIINSIGKDEKYFEIIQHLFDNDIWGKIKNSIYQKMQEKILIDDFIDGLFIGYDENKEFGNKDFQFWFFNEEETFNITFKFDEGGYLKYKVNEKRYEDFEEYSEISWYKLYNDCNTGVEIIRNKIKEYYES